MDMTKIMKEKKKKTRSHKVVIKTSGAKSLKELLG